MFVLKKMPYGGLNKSLRNYRVVYLVLRFADFNRFFAVLTTLCIKIRAKGFSGCLFGLFNGNVALHGICAIAKEIAFHLLRKVFARARVG